MKRLLATILVALLIPLTTLAKDWSGVAHKLAQSTVMLMDEHGDGYCAAFSIDDKRDHFMTASHCTDNGAILVNDKVAEVLYNSGYGNGELDAAVLRIEGLDVPALKPRTKLIRVGMEAASYGFALKDRLKGHFRAGNVSEIVWDRYNNPWVFLDQAGIGGMSGGPMVDEDGKVIAVNQISDHHRHFAGIDISLVYQATKEFWR